MDSTETDKATQRRPAMPGPVRTLLVVGLLYLFLIGVKLLEDGINGLGSDFTDTLFQGVSNPVAGLFVGVLVTVLVAVLLIAVQSSSIRCSWPTNWPVSRCDERRWQSGTRCQCSSLYL